MKHSTLRFLARASEKASVAACMLAVISGCSGAGVPAASVPRTQAADAAGLNPWTAATPSKIQHVIFIVQENRSFNYLFMGFPGARTRNYGYDKTGKKIKLHAQGLSEPWDIDHSSTAFFTACDGDPLGQNCKNDGWNDEQTCCGSPPPNFAYAYAPRSQVAPYWDMATSYVLADNMFQSNLDGSFVAHQYIVAAYAKGTVDYPSSAIWGCPGGPHDVVSTLNVDRSYGPSIRPCFDDRTIGAEADRAGISWRFYAGPYDGDGGLWSSYQAIRPIHSSPDWSKDVISPPAQFLTDIGNGQLAGITWITPDLGHSDHPGTLDNGPQWVTSVVNAIGKSQFWSSSAIFLIWDDWGGWFDPVPPVYVDYDGLGYRIPLIIISPYSKKGYVSHVQYETSSVLKFIEDNFGLARLAASDARAADPAADAFDFTKRPRKFRPFRSAERMPVGLTQGHTAWTASTRARFGD
jgi:phospholipase C